MFCVLFQIQIYPQKPGKQLIIEGFNFSKSALVIKGMNEKVQFRFVSNLVVVVVHRESRLLCCFNTCCDRLL